MSQETQPTFPVQTPYPHKLSPRLGYCALLFHDLVDEPTHTLYVTTDDIDTLRRRMSQEKCRWSIRNRTTLLDAYYVLVERTEQRTYENRTIDNLVIIQLRIKDSVVKRTEEPKPKKQPYVGKLEDM